MSKQHTESYKMYGEEIAQLIAQQSAKRSNLFQIYFEIVLRRARQNGRLGRVELVANPRHTALFFRVQ